MDALTIFGLFASGTVGFSWLAREILSRALNVLADSHKQRLEQDAAIALKRIDAELQVATHLAQARNASLIEKRFAAIETFHGDLIELRLVIGEIDRLAAIRVADVPDTVPAELQARMLKGIETYKRTFKTVRIWLDRDTCELVRSAEQLLAAAFMQSFYDVAVSHGESGKRISERIEKEIIGVVAKSTDLTNAAVVEVMRSNLKPTLDKLTERLEDQLRKLVGAE